MGIWKRAGKSSISFRRPLGVSIFESGKGERGGKGEKWKRATIRGFQTREPTKFDSHLFEVYWLFSQYMRMRTHLISMLRHWPSPRNNVLDVDLQQLVPSPAYAMLRVSRPDA